MNKKKEYISEEKTYKYNIMVTSADGYRCMISWVGCYLGDAPMPFSTDNSWGEGSSIVSSDGLNTAPEDIRLVYYSLTENQFYRLKAPLPKDKIKKLLEEKYKREGYDDLDTNDVFTVGIAPCGFVNLWLGGGASQFYLASFQAEKANDVDYHKAFPVDNWDQEEVFIEYSKNLYPFIQEEMKQNCISSAYWESLNTPYNWKLEFNDDRFSLYDYRIYTINQEYREYLTDSLWPVIASQKFIPSELILYLKHELDPIKYKLVIELREESITYSKKENEETTVLNHMNKSRTLLQFFESFYKKADGQDVSLYLDFEESMESMKLKLKAGNLEEELPAYTYKIYDSERYNYR